MVYHIRFRSGFRCSIRSTESGDAEEREAQRRLEIATRERGTREAHRSLGKSAYLHLMRTTPLCSSSISRRRMFLTTIHSRNTLPLSRSFFPSPSLHHRSERIRRTQSRYHTRIHSRARARIHTRAPAHRYLYITCTHPRTHQRARARTSDARLLYDFARRKITSGTCAGRGLHN